MLGGAGFGIWLTGKLGRAWHWCTGGAWHGIGAWHWGVLHWVFDLGGDLEMTTHRGSPGSAVGSLTNISENSNILNRSARDIYLCKRMFPYLHTKWGP